MKKLKKVIAFALSVICCFSMSAVSFAAESSSNEDVSVVVAEAVQPRVGIAGFENHYHSGGERSTFYITTDNIFWPAKEFTVQTSDFNDFTVIKIAIFNSKNQLVAGFTGEGNAKWPNKDMSANFINGDTYRIVCTISDPNDDGWIGIWIF